MVYKLQLDSEKTYSHRTVISRILKLDENNQYGYTISKPFSTSCIKVEEKILSWKKFNVLRKMFGLFIVSIRFNNAKAYNVIYTPIFEKKRLQTRPKDLSLN